jgi:hypothetical protein
MDSENHNKLAALLHCQGKYGPAVKPYSFNKRLLAFVVVCKRLFTAISNNKMLFISYLGETASHSKFHTYSVFF